MVGRPYQNSAPRRFGAEPDSGLGRKAARARFPRRSVGSVGTRSPEIYPKHRATRRVRLAHRLHYLATMRTSALVELSAWIAVNGRAFLRAGDRLSDSGVHQYWSASKLRLDRWTECLAAYDRHPPADRRAHRRMWRGVAPVLEEVLSGELLTRLWTTVACEHDRRYGPSYVTPVVRSVLLAHLEARNRALSVMFHAQDHDLEEVLRVNRLRSLSERWTDLLLAQLMPDCDAAELAFDAKRVHDFAGDVRDQRNALDADSTCRLLQGALQSAFRKRLSTSALHPELNASIAAGILASFRPEQFDATGPFQSLWMLRLDHTADDAQALIDELLAVS